MDNGVPAGAKQEVVNLVGAGDGGAPAPGGEPSSSSSGKPSTETSACEQRREGGEPGKKRRRDEESEEEVYEYSEVADAINKFTEAYIKIETTKIEAKKIAIDRQTRLAVMTMEMKDRRYKSMLETQLAMAKLVAEPVKGALDRCLDNTTRDRSN